MITSDFLVIGSGVAGLSFALRAAEHGKVIVLCKSDPLVSSSAKAQGGIAAVMDANDTFEEHVADTLDAGAGLCDEAVVRTIVTEAPDCIRTLLHHLSMPSATWLSQAGIRRLMPLISTTQMRQAAIWLMFLR